MNVAEKDLLPCPFCGSQPEYERMGTAKHSCIINCTHCGCSLETGEVWSCGQEWNRRHGSTNAVKAGVGGEVREDDKRQ